MSSASGGHDRPGSAEVRLESTLLGDTLVLDQPARRNALTLPMWQRLGELARDVGDSTAPLYVLGVGGYFCSGADLDALRWARTQEDRAVEFVDAVVRCLLSLHTAYREVVAVVEGGAAGGGVEVAQEQHFDPDRAGRILETETAHLAQARHLTLGLEPALRRDPGREELDLARRQRGA